MTIFDPIQVASLTIPNRIVMPPMVCFNWSFDGHPSQHHIKHYALRAAAGTGLIIVEATAIDPTLKLHECQMGLWDDKFIPDFRKLTDAVHQYDSKILLQIHAHAFKPETVTAGRLAGIVRAYSDAAGRAIQAGFDGIELHGAHGYLLDRFNNPNQRADAWGVPGALSKRVIAAIRDKYPDLLIGYRFGANAPTLEQGCILAKELEQAGVQLLHISSSGYGTGNIEKLRSAHDGSPYSGILHLGMEIKKHVSIPVIGVYGVRTAQQAEPLVAQGLLDMIAVGRAHLADAAWTAHARDGVYLTCLDCKPRCHWYTQPEKCPHYAKNTGA